MMLLQTTTVLFSDKTTWVFICYENITFPVQTAAPVFTFPAEAKRASVKTVINIFPKSTPRKVSKTEKQKIRDGSNIYCFEHELPSILSRTQTEIMKFIRTLELYRTLKNQNSLKIQP